MELSQEFFMKMAQKQAELAFAADEVPIGAVVVANNQIIGKGFNQVETLNDPTAHAEMLAITAASSFLNSKYLNECTIYVTVEPCVMCYGAIKNARIKQVILGCLEPKHGFTNFVSKSSKLNIKTGILEGESVELMKSFFSTKRGLTNEN
jgi:tRNA(adenine34) deaminase